MKQLIWLALLCTAFTAPAHAQDGMKGDAEAAQKQSKQPEPVTLQTRYGTVQYYRRGGPVIAGGFPWDTLFYVTRDWGVFQLNDKDVIFFENFDPEFQGEAFFVVLKPGKDAEFIRVPIEPVSQPIKKVWQEGEVIYVDIKVDAKDGVTTPVKFDFSKTPFGPRLSDA